MDKVRVGVVRGGLSSEYDVSLKTGATVLKRMNTEKYIPKDVLLTKKGEWILDGLLVDPARVAESVDVVWNALHGEFGEDGKVQKLFEDFRLPYTGSRVLPSAIAMNKQLAKERFRELGLRTPTGVVVEEDDDVEESVFAIFRDFVLPVVIKPVNGGSSIGVTIAKNFDELMRGVEAARQFGAVLVEEFVQGQEATCAVVDAEGSGVFALHPIEIIPHNPNGFFDYDAKYQGKSDEICPGNFSADDSHILRTMASKVHRGLGLRHYSRTDFIVAPRGIYVLEVNTLPGITEASLLPKALAAADISITDFIDHVLGLALSGR